MRLIPGFPTLIFVILGLLVGSDAGLLIWNKLEKQPPKPQPALMAAVETDVEGHAMVRGGSDEYALTLPVILEVGKNISQIIRKERQGRTPSSKR